jgi:hypothetical protein
MVFRLGLRFEKVSFSVTFTQTGFFTITHFPIQIYLRFGSWDLLWVLSF